jgi:hypothetical protein
LLGQLSKRKEDIRLPQPQTATAATPGRAFSAATAVAGRTTAAASLQRGRALHNDLF